MPHDLLLSVRVSLDGIGDVHDQVRHVTNGFDKACETIDAMQALADEYPNFQFGVASTIFATNLEDARNILTWARTKKLDIVFNMLRFTDAMLNNKELESTIGFAAREEAFMREFFLERVQEESVLSGQAFLYLHYAEMIANGYQRTMPCPFQTQGLLLNPYGDLYFCENSQAIGNVLTTPAEDALFQGREPCPSRGDRQQGLSDLSQSLPGQRRRDEAGRAVRQVPDARLQGQARSCPGSRSTALRAAATRVARLAVAGGLTAYILWKSHPREVLAAAAGMDWRPVVVAIVLVLLDRALMAYRWVVLLYTLEPVDRPPLRDILRVFFVSTFLGQLSAERRRRRGARLRHREAPDADRRRGRVGVHGSHAGHRVAAGDGAGRPGARARPRRATGSILGVAGGGGRRVSGDAAAGVQPPRARSPSPPF